MPTKKTEPHTTAFLGTGFVSDVQLGQKIGVPVSTLRRWRLLGEGPEFKKFGRSVRYNLISVQAWVDSLPSGGAPLRSA